MNIQKSSLPQNLLCFSHLRWNFVFQRPQHLMSHFSKELNVYVLEEPVFDTNEAPYLEHQQQNDNLYVLIPHLPHNLNAEDTQLEMKNLLEQFLGRVNLADWIFWYYTPMALQFSNHFSAALTVFDCMDELSAFDFAPAELVSLEKSLLMKADIVFTGGYSLHEAKKDQHDNIYVFPSSIDKAHFHLARTAKSEPADQAVIKGVKLGFIGVIDERFDAPLINELAQKRPDWQFIMLGPIVKIAPDSLPKGNNLHYLGQKSYAELPNYLSGWDVAMIPFAINNSTKFISPTKTPEYLAAGVRVVSTPIRDVVRPYGMEGLVSIASDAEGFITAIELYLNDEEKENWQEKSDKFLADKSWKDTFKQMREKMIQTKFEIEKRLAS
jgi:glycosyltransferase involved in cell wall biosynthesis